jgi:hypothetical protein
MFHTPLGIRKAGCFVLLCILKRRKCIRGLFLGVFGRWSFAGVVPHLQRHPRVRCAHVVIDVKVLGQSFTYEERSCYVGNLCERFSSVNHAKNKTSQQESVLRRDSVMLAACFKNLSRSDPCFSGVIGQVVHESSYEALLSNMGPAKETRGVRDSFAEVAFFLAKIGRLRRKDFSSTIMYLYVRNMLYIPPLHVHVTVSIVLPCHSHGICKRHTHKSEVSASANHMDQQAHFGSGKGVLVLAALSSHSGQFSGSFH